MNEMKRRVAAILEFVGRMQGENGQAHHSQGPGQGQGANSRSSGEGSGGSGGTPNNGGTSMNVNVSGLPTASSLVQAVELAIGKGIAGGGVGGSSAVVMVEDSSTTMIGAAGGSGAGNAMIPTTAGKDFREMGSGEMMEVLTRELIGWQNSFGRYGEK